MKTLIWTGLFVGSLVGQFVPTLWGAELLSLQTVFGSAIGSIIGVWIGYKIGKEYL